MGNRSTGREVRGVRRTLVRLPGFLVEAEICIPRAHAHALWLLPWVERLLSGTPWDALTRQPPWPEPADPLVVQHLARTLVDLRWAVPNWSGGGVEVDPSLRQAFEAGGRTGLARRLFDAEVIRGEWWADGLSGTVISRQTAIQFDWDLQRRAKIVLEPSGPPQGLIDGAEPDLLDLITKLNGVEDAWESRDAAFLGTSLRAGERIDLLFPMFGDGLRLLPDELAELEPALLENSPEIFGEKRTTRSRVVRLEKSPVERLLSEVERLPTSPVALGPSAVVHARCQRITELCGELAEPLAEWIDDGARVRPVAGPTPRHFDALAEMCHGMHGTEEPTLLMTSAFLNARNAGDPDGLAGCLAAAPEDARFVMVYGHANDDTPDRQAADIEAWVDALSLADADVARRMTVVAGERRSHEKVIVSSAGAWLVGSWNPASSRPGATVFECSLAGNDARMAARLLDAVGPNIAAPSAVSHVERLRKALHARFRHARTGTASVERLRTAAALLASAIPDEDGGRAEAWCLAVRNLRAAVQPFRATTKLTLLDEHQTRDAFMAHVRAAQRSVLLASDRLADSALGPATLRDLEGDGRSRRTVRFVWGREWAGRRPTDKLAREQLKRAASTVRDASKRLGGALLASEAPMENHGKALVADGLRGLVTSENLLSYGGEKGRYESRELGLAFWGPSLARELIGRFLHHWPDPLLDGGRAPDAPLAWVAAGSEAWHALSSVSDELDFDWRAPSYIELVLRAELDEGSTDAPKQANARREAFNDQSLRVGGVVGPWLREEGERLGLLAVDLDGLWSPWDTDVSPESACRLSEQATEAAGALPAPKERNHAASLAAGECHPLVTRVLEGMVRISAGEFSMGDERVRDERPVHRVTISRDFLLGATPVTQGLWEEVMGRLPSLRDSERHPEYPIIHISWRDITQFLGRLNALPGSGRFELPTEAQWEYACRAGSTGIYCFGDDPGPGNRPGALERYAWTKRSGKRQLQRVGLLQPNAWGLHDMHGLVYETMRDGRRTYSRRPVVDPIGPTSGDPIVARGGCWSRWPTDARQARNEHFRSASRQTYQKGHRCSIRLAWRLEDGE